MLGDSSYGWLQIRPLSGRLSHLHPDLIGPPLGRDQCRDDPLANDAPTSMRHRPQYFDGPHSAGAHLESKLSLRLRCTSAWAVARATARKFCCVVAVLAAGTALAALAALDAALAAIAAGRFRTCRHGRCGRCYLSAVFGVSPPSPPSPTIAALATLATLAALAIRSAVAGSGPGHLRNTVVGYHTS